MLNRKGLALSLLAVLACSLLLSPISVPVTHASSGTPITMQWLQQQAIAWKPAQNTTMGFAALAARASYDNLETAYNTMDVQDADLAMLRSADSACVRVDVNYAPWLLNQTSYIAEMDSVISGVRAQGQCVILADAASQTYYQAPLSWSQFKSVWAPRDETLAARYHPDYFIVVKEPGFYAPMVKYSSTNLQFNNPSDWVTLTTNLAQAVHSVSPSTKVGISVPADAVGSTFTNKYVKGVYGIAGVAFVGFDIYDETGFTNTHSFLTNNGNGGKLVWVAEAWSGTANLAFNSTRATLDKEWMLVLYYFAQLIHAQLVMPFFTDIFASYGPYSTTPSDLVSMYQTQRQPVFYEYQSIALSYGITP